MIGSLKVKAILISVGDHREGGGRNAGGVSTDTGTAKAFGVHNLYFTSP